LVIGQIKNGWSGQHEVLKGWRQAGGIGRAMSAVTGGAWSWSSSFPKTPTCPTCPTWC